MSLLNYQNMERGTSHFPQPYCMAFNIPVPQPEYRFDKVRKWRLDYAWPDVFLAVEIEGAVWINGRHTRGAGYVKDMEKYNALNVQGWTLLRYEPRKIDYQTIALVYQRLKK